MLTLYVYCYYGQIGVFFQSGYMYYINQLD